MRSLFGLPVSIKIAYLLILSILLWSVGVSTLLNRVLAANLTSISDTLTSSNLSTLAKHTIQFTTDTSLTAGQTIKIQFDPATNRFVQAFSVATTTDFYSSGFTTVANAAGCNGGASDQAYPTGNYNDGADENVTYTVCSGDTIPAGTLVIGIGTSTRLITNPSIQGSYRIFVVAQANSGETRVAILNTVTLTASVSTSFTFTVTGLATSSTVNGDTTTASSSPTTLPFSTLVNGAPTVLAQILTVNTNARNGFSVTVQENQPPTSSTGATIDLFKDGATTTNPTAWTSPLATLDVPSTYGHFGITSDDVDYFDASEYAGNIDQPRTVFSHNGPVAGATTGAGTTRVGYKIEISALQEAGDDYTNTLTYVATPTF